MKRGFSLISILLMLFMLIATIPTSAFAFELKPNVNYEENGIQTVYFDKSSNAASKVVTIYSDGKTVSYEVSDPSIATPSFKNYKTANGYVTAFTLKFKKAGKVYTTQNFINNENTNCERFMAYETAQYKSPLKALKLGKKDLSKKVKHSYCFTGKAFKGKVSFKLNSGWKFVKMYKFKTNDLRKSEGAKIIKLKKSKTVNLKKGERLVICFKKGKKTISMLYTAN
ncbi:MAG: hypothetical protein IJJ06_12260 [Mogibacterium sp.]|nr:hypothetical protein [Mogibacterium sp.]